MQDNLIERIKSKHACDCCKNHTLVTNNSLDRDDVIFYQCMNCGYQFFLTREQLQLREKSKQDDDESPWNAGFLLFFAMLVTILLINQTRHNNALAMKLRIQTGVGGVIEANIQQSDVSLKVKPATAETHYD